jgi:hypothetical protein
MKHERIKLVTFRTEEWMEKRSLHHSASMNSFYEQEQRASRGLEMARARRRRKYIAQDM